MILQVVKSSEDKRKVKFIIENYHSYVPSNRSVGRRIDWLIYEDDRFTVLGMIGIGSSVYPPPKDMLTHLKVTKEEYRGIFNSIANNWRYCLIKSVKNLGTQVLKELRKQAKTEWERQYGDDLKYIVTFVGANHDGAMYKADNWKHIGHTSGLPKHESSSMKWDNAESLKRKFVKPTGENKKMIFMKEI